MNVSTSEWRSSVNTRIATHPTMPTFPLPKHSIAGSELWYRIAKELLISQNFVDTFEDRNSISLSIVKMLNVFNKIFYRLNLPNELRCSTRIINSVLTELGMVHYERYNYYNKDLDRKIIRTRTSVKCSQKMFSRAIRVGTNQRLRLIDSFFARKDAIFILEQLALLGLPVPASERAFPYLF